MAQGRGAGDRAGCRGAAPSQLALVRRPPRWKKTAVSEGDSRVFFLRFSEIFIRCLLKLQRGPCQECCHSSLFSQAAGGCGQSVPGPLEKPLPSSASELCHVVAEQSFSRCGEKHHPLKWQEHNCVLESIS